jgi:transcriptional regulator with XRE-family HTH domain
MKLDKLSQYIEELGYGGISRLSSELGISKEALRLIINGETKNPSVYTMAKIAEILNCTIDELIGRTPKASSSQLHSVNISFDKKLFLDVCNFVTKFISDKLKDKNSDIKLDVVINVIDAIYDYSYKKSPQELDKQFADWYCSNYFLK